MFFHAHVYYAKKVDENLDNLKIIGSILPDLALTSEITWDNLHKKKDILEFASFVDKSHSEFSPLLKGINYHNTVDYLSHLKYKESEPGYAYSSITPQLSNLAKKAFNISDERVKASCHNLIEAGVEYRLLTDNPDLPAFLKGSIKEADIQKLAGLFSAFYKKDKSEMLDKLNFFFDFATKYDLKDIKGWVDLFAYMNKFYLKVEVDRKLTREVLELSFDITKDTYKEFLKTAVSVKEMEIVDSS